ncbi:PTS lactose/cellobiose transporter subunit IIA [Amphibacillus cookii]|uniref:PTS lactose/cellobiose transporter subunit IIA n=1 Tax=Amphibacillus cookii TaxID=767787 RepID=UPI00195A4149|nr:PTS lactose/cellobiose transporter subunit IIA [Amphibacillus cookii]MBM7539823.1 cellobiose-specific phosphotransferase system component IIA [Amphibacillus cookii]
MELYEESFTLILHAGNASSKAQMAIQEAREHHFTEAEKLIEEGAKELRLAHDSQTQLIQKEANGEQTKLSILLVHAQDHLTTAMINIAHAEEFLHIYKQLAGLKKEENE